MNRKTSHQKNHKSRHRHDDEGPGDPTKRASMKGFLRLLFAIGGSAPKVTAQLTTYINNPVVSGLIGAAGGAEIGIIHDESDKSERDDKERKEIGRHLLFEGSYKQFGVPTMDNPFAPFKEGISKPTGEAAASIISKLGMNTEDLEVVPDLKIGKVDGSVILLGGPVGNGHSRHILGVRGASPLLSKVHPQEESFLPIRFDTETPQYEGDLLNYSYGTGQRPRWHLVVETKTGTYHQKATIRDGVQVNDFLVITSIPNVYSQNFFDRIVIVSGLHGPGTRAIGKVLGDLGILDRLNKCTKGKSYEAWQALIFINKIEPGTGQPLEIVFDEKYVYEVKKDFGLLRDRLKDQPLGYHEKSVVIDRPLKI